MPYTRSEILRRGLLIALLAFVLLAVALLIGWCACNSCTKYSPPFVQMQTYDEVKNAFKRNKKMHFPDLAALELDESTVSYSACYVSRSRRNANEYSVYGDRVIAGETISFSFSAEDPEVYKAWGTQYTPTQYAENRVISIPDLRPDSGHYSEDVFFRFDGHLYCLKARFEPSSEKPPIGRRELIALNDEVHKIMLDYMNAFLDEIKAK